VIKKYYVSRQTTITLYDVLFIVAHINYGPIFICM